MVFSDAHMTRDLSLHFLLVLLPVGATYTKMVPQHDACPQSLLAEAESCRVCARRGETRAAASGWCHIFPHLVTKHTHIYHP